MSAVDRAGQVWEETSTNNSWLILHRDVARDEWMVVCLVSGLTWLKPGCVSWAGDMWFSGSTVKRLA